MEASRSLKIPLVSSRKNCTWRLNVQVRETTPKKLQMVPWTSRLCKTGLIWLMVISISCSKIFLVPRRTAWTSHRLSWRVFKWTQSKWPMTKSITVTRQIWMVATTSLAEDAYSLATQRMCVIEHSEQRRFQSAQACSSTITRVLVAQSPMLARFCLETDD